MAKRDLYASIGVKDYFMFDPAGRYLDEPLLGFRLDMKRPSKVVAPTRLPDGGLLGAGGAASSLLFGVGAPVIMAGAIINGIGTGASWLSDC